MQTGLAFGFVGAAMAVAWIGVNVLNNEVAPADIDTSMTTTAINRPNPKVERPQEEIYVIKSADGDAGCRVIKGQALSPGYAKVRLTSACEKLLPGLATAQYWREREDGSVALSADASDPIAEFSAGDGVDYESYAPAATILSLKAE